MNLGDLVGTHELLEEAESSPCVPDRSGRGSRDSRRCRGAGPRAPPAACASVVIFCRSGVTGACPRLDLGHRQVGAREQGGLDHDLHSAGGDPQGRVEAGSEGRAWILGCTDQPESLVRFPGPSRGKAISLGLFRRRQARPGGLGLRSRPPGGALSPMPCPNGCPLRARSARHHPARRRALHRRGHPRCR